MFLRGPNYEPTFNFIGLKKNLGWCQLFFFFLRVDKYNFFLIIIYKKNFPSQGVPVTIPG